MLPVWSSMTTRASTTALAGQTCQLPVSAMNPPEEDSKTILNRRQHDIDEQGYEDVSIASSSVAPNYEENDGLRPRSAERVRSSTGRPGTVQKQREQRRSTSRWRVLFSWRMLLAVFFIFIFYYLFIPAKSSKKPEIIYATRYSKEFKYRPAASPIITETLKDGRIRIRGADPALYSNPTQTAKPKPTAAKMKGKTGTGTRKKKVTATKGKGK